MPSYLDSPLYQQMLARTLSQGQPQSQYQGQAIANTMAQLLQAYQLKQADQATKEKEAAGNNTIAGLLAPVNAQQNPMAGPLAQPTPTDTIDPVSSTPQRLVDANSDKRSQLAALLNTGAIPREALAPQILQGLGMGAPKSPIKLAEGDSLYDPTTFKPIVQPKPKPVSVSRDARLVDPTTGQPIVDLAPQEVDYNKAFLPDGTPNKAYQGYELNKAAAGRPTTSVSVSADKSFATQLGGKAADTVDALATAARGAANAIPVINQIYGALDSGKVTAGPGASAVQFFNQVSGGDQKKIVATRQTIQGLAQLALSARSQLKGQGQISDFEGKLLQRATAGDIDSMTVPEIRSITQVAERAARATIRAGQDAVARAKQVPGGENMAGFYEVQEPPPYKPQTSVDDLLNKYLGGRK